MKVEKTFYWKYLSSDGLLLEPEAIGPCYNGFDLNNGGSFNTEEEAIKRLKEYRKLTGLGVQFFLITEYCI